MLAEEIGKVIHADTGEALERQGIAILRMDEDGQIAECWSAYR